MASLIYWLDATALLVTSSPSTADHYNQDDQQPNQPSFPQAERYTTTTAEHSSQDKPQPQDQRRAQIRDQQHEIARQRSDWTPKGRACPPLLLEPTNPQARTLNADGRLNYNVAYLALGPTLQARRKALVIKISGYLGVKMDDWHEALHRPEGLPPNALDWSTVLLKQTLDLAEKVPGKDLSGVYQAMTAMKMSILVKAALHLRTAEPTSAIGVEICHLRETVLSLQKRIDDETDLELATQDLEAHTLQDGTVGKSIPEDAEAPVNFATQQRMQLQQQVLRLDRESNAHHNELCMKNDTLQGLLNGALAKIERLKDGFNDDEPVWEEVDLGNGKLTRISDLNFVEICKDGVTTTRKLTERELLEQAARAAAKAYRPPDHFTF
jgi:hypothetical protein